MKCKVKPLALLHDRVLVYIMGLNACYIFAGIRESSFELKTLTSSRSGQIAVLCSSDIVFFYILLFFHTSKACLLYITSVGEEENA